MQLRVCAVAELPPGEVAVAQGPPRIAVFNVDGELYALEDQCTHQQAWLSDGFVEGCAVECPLHASLFDLRTGKPSGPPAIRAVRTYQVAVVDEQIMVTVEDS
jgi:3-phenylpropionate/trans-cinnamate dioxygenase ferredoxin subunit